jgi:hypothetical protein
MKRTLVALLVGAVLFGSIYALAASLTVTSATLGAGNTAVAACQSGTVNVTYSGNTYGSTSPAGYKTTTVTLNGLDETAGACGGKAVKVTLTGPGLSNASLGEGTGTLPTGSGTTYDLTISGVSASDVTGVHVLIAG